jgi:DNA-binding transcriptional regulator YhcF (GntR family)
MENNFMKETDLDQLCAGASPEEIKQLYKMVNEWGNGDPNSFPVQLALLTKGQWRAAARIPSLLAEKMAVHQKEMAAALKNFSSANDAKTKTLEGTIATHTESMKKVASQSWENLEEIEKYARQIRERMEYGLRESDRITKSFIDERHRLEQARRDYERSMEWWDVFQRFLALMLASAFGFIIGWYYFAHPH